MPDRPGREGIPDRGGGLAVQLGLFLRHDHRNTEPVRQPAQPANPIDDDRGLVIRQLPDKALLRIDDDENAAVGVQSAAHTLDLATVVH